MSIIDSKSVAVLYELRADKRWGHGRAMQLLKILLCRLMGHEFKEAYQADDHVFAIRCEHDCGTRIYITEQY